MPNKQKKQDRAERIDPIVKQRGDKKWIVANRYDGRMLRGPFDEEGGAYAALKGKGSAKAD